MDDGVQGGFETFLEGPSGLTDESLSDRTIRDEESEQIPEVPTFEQRPRDLTLMLALDVIPGWRLHEMATCLGLWNTEGMAKAELVRLMQRAPMANVDAVWRLMSVLERGLARRNLSVPKIVAEVKAAPTVVRSLFEMLDPRLLSGRLGSSLAHGLDLAGTIYETVCAPTRRLMSLLALLPLPRLGEIARALDVQASDPLTLAGTVEKKHIPSKRVLGVMTDRELRTAAAVWAVTATRAQLIDQLAGAMDRPVEPDEGGLGTTSMGS
jgi:hypothetical protein